MIFSLFDTPLAHTSINTSNFFFLYFKQKSRRKNYTHSHTYAQEGGRSVCDENEILHQITAHLIVIKFHIAHVAGHILFSNECAQ